MNFTTNINWTYYTCTESCPSQYSKLIEPKRKCIDDCEKDDEYKYEYNNKCLKECPENKKLYETEKICLDACRPNLFEYENKCYDDCPQGTFKSFDIKNICFASVPENYYLDGDIYKKCYDTCKKCSKSGDETNNNCDECITNYKFLDDPLATKNNCYKNCDYYYYFNEAKQYICTESNSCPSKYSKLIESKRKCTDDCKKDGEYEYEYNNECLKECPANTKIDTEGKRCFTSCNQNQFEYNYMCNDALSNNTNISILQEQEGIIYVKNISNISSILSDILLPQYTPKEGNSLTIKDDDAIYQVTNSKNEIELIKNISNKAHNISVNILNTSIIDLGE